MRRMLLVLIAIFVFSAITLAGQFEIVGYQSGIYVLDGEQKNQLDKKVADRISEEFSLIQNKAGKDYQIETIITITGFADQTGSRIKNQDLGQDRAEQVEKRLRGRFPKATITSCSEGDQKDVKKVVINWVFKINPISTGSFPWVKVIFLTASLVIVISLSYLFLLKNKKQKDANITEQIASNTVWKDVESEGKVYGVFIEIKDGKHFIPFTSKNNPSELMFRAEWVDAKTLIKQCLKDSYYKSAKEELLKAGQLKIKRQIL